MKSINNLLELFDSVSEGLWVSHVDIYDKGGDSSENEVCRCSKGKSSQYVKNVEESNCTIRLILLNLFEAFYANLELLVGSTFLHRDASDPFVMALSSSNYKIDSFVETYRRVGSQICLEPIWLKCSLRIQLVFSR